MAGKQKTKWGYRVAVAVLTVVAAALVLAYGLLSNDRSTTNSSDPASGDAPVSSATQESGETQGGEQPPTSAIQLPTEEDTVVSLLACGDNLIHPSVYYYAMECYAETHQEQCTYVATNDANYDFLPIYEHVADRMQAADICYINQETLSGGDGTKIYGYPTFNSPEAVGRTLKELGVDVVNMAHNHMLDAGNDSFLIHSDGFFRSLGMTPLGYYVNQAATDTIPIVESKGLKFAFLAYTYSTNGITCNSGTYIPYLDESLVRKQVALAKQQADVVVVSAHWGDEDSYTPNAEQKRYAELFCSLGVDAVIGMHSHCIQPMQWMDRPDGKKMLLTYSLGNFVSGMQNGLNVLEGMLSFDVRKNAETGEITVENPVFNPLVLHYVKGQSVNTQLDTGYRGFKLYDLKDYTAELAAQHGVVWYETNRGHRTTLYGGAFGIDSLYTTLQTIIPSEFLPSEYR